MREPYTMVNQQKRDFAMYKSHAIEKYQRQDFSRYKQNTIQRKRKKPNLMQKKQNQNSQKCELHAV